MRKKNLYLSAFAALTAWGLTSCANDADLANTTSEKAQMNSVTFKISMPGGDPVHYTRAVQDGNEYAFQNLTLLVYDAASNKLLEKVDMTQAATGSGSYSSSSLSSASVASNGNDYNYTYTTTPEEGTMARRFVVVANDALTNVAVGDDYSELNNETVTKELADNDDLTTVFASGYLPMSGIAKLSTNQTTVIPMNTGSAVTVDVELVRAVARIDVANNVPNLEITNLQLINANPKGYLMQHGTAGSISVPTSMTKVNNLTPFNDIANLVAYDNTDPSNPVVHDNVLFTGRFLPYIQSPFVPATLKKAFYVYEDVIATAGTDDLTLLVQGTLGGSIPVYYSIPFTNAKLTTPVADGNRLEIQRNHLYTLTLGSGTPINVNTTLLATLSFADWTSQSVPATYDATIFVGSVLNTSGTYTRATQLFDVTAPSTTGDVAKITVADGYYDSGSGVTIKEVQVLVDDADYGTAQTTSATDDWLTATIDDTQHVTLSIGSANTSGAARTGSVRITYQNSTSDTTDRYVVFSVTQAGV